MLHVENSIDVSPCHLSCGLPALIVDRVVSAPCCCSRFLFRDVWIKLKEAAEADLLDATACLYKMGADKACHRWSFMLKRERTATSTVEFNFNFMNFWHWIIVSRRLKLWSSAQKSPFIDIRRNFCFRIEESLCDTKDKWPILFIGTLIGKCCL